MFKFIFKFYHFYYYLFIYLKKLYGQLRKQQTKLKSILTDNISMQFKDISISVELAINLLK